MNTEHLKAARTSPSDEPDTWRLKLKLALYIAIIWPILTAFYAWYYVVSILSSPEPYDAYAMNWQFQLLMFCIFRLPYVLLALSIIFGLILVLPLRSLLKNPRP